MRTAESPPTIKKRPTQLKKIKERVRTSVSTKGKLSNKVTPNQSFENQNLQRFTPSNVIPSRLGQRLGRSSFSRKSTNPQNNSKLLNLSLQHNDSANNLSMSRNSSKEKKLDLSFQRQLKTQPAAPAMNSRILISSRSLSVGSEHVIIHRI